MIRLREPFRELRWKLTLSYTAVTLAALVVAIMAVAFLLFSFVLAPDEIASPGFWVKTVNRDIGPVVAYLLAEEPINADGIEFLLQNIQPTLSDFDLLQIGDTQLFVRTAAQLDVLVTDADGVLVSVTPNLLRAGAVLGRPMDSSRIPGLEGPLQAALAGESNPELLTSRPEPDYELIVAVPVFHYREDEMHVFSREQVGTLALIFESLPTKSDIPAHTVQLLGRSVLIFLLAAGIMGTLFGFLTAREPSSRFQRLSTAADAWSQGNFAEFVDDPHGDELGQLADRLNHMAEQLQDLLEEREEIAVYEERNRLARDLHDAVTQTLFSASLIAEALPELWESDQDEGRLLLEDLRLLSRGALAEMRTLLLELRPAALVESNLGDLLRQLAEAVIGRSGVPVTVSMNGWRDLGSVAPALPLDVHVALYRITQEALNNVVKHANADHVEVDLRCALDAEDGVSEGRRQVELWVRDNGRGFDPSSIPPDRLGLRIIRERTQAIGASFQIESQSGRGTQIGVMWQDPPSPRRAGDA
jgi:signal transduction histidine kinase